VVGTGTLQELQPSVTLIFGVVENVEEVLNASGPLVGFAVLLNACSPLAGWIGGFVVGDAIDGATVGVVGLSALPGAVETQILSFSSCNSQMLSAFGRELLNVRCLCFDFLYNSCLKHFSF
jgi:hypothetical protein